MAVNGSALDGGTEGGSWVAAPPSNKQKLETYTNILEGLA